MKRLTKTLVLASVLLAPTIATADHNRVATNLAINSIAASTYATSQSDREHHVAENVDYLRENHAAIQADIAMGDGEALQTALTLYGTANRSQTIATLRQSLPTLAELPAAEKAARLDTILRS